MKSEAEALRDARAAIEAVRDELNVRRGPNAEKRLELIRRLNGALVDMTTADIQAGRRGVGAALVDRAERQ
jgi:hypothetical protein